MKLIDRIKYILKDVYRNPMRFKYYSKKVGERSLSMLLKSKIIESQDKKLLESFDSNIKKLIIFLVPGWDGVNGGVMSICSLARVSKNLKSLHDAEVLIATIPKHSLFDKYSGFESSFDIYRFEQLFNYFTELEDLVLHIPENFVIDFLNNISSEDSRRIKEVNNLQINVMNQNIWLMPEVEHIDRLREITSNITITVAHQKYCTKKLRDKYKSTVHLFSTSNLTEYYYRKYEDKENLLLTSIDEHPLKEQIVSKIKEEFPLLKVKKIENMNYEEYKNWISRAKWMITFGEGIDGYFCESIRSGAIPFAVYNADFFSNTFEGLVNVYESYKEMLNQIAYDIKHLDNPTSFKEHNDHLIALDKIEYNDEEYKKNICDYYLGEYTLPYPGNEKLKKLRTERLKQKPLVSVVMAVYNGELYLKEQLESISNLTYNNIELIISDDGSDDSTLKIIKEFQQKFPLKLIINKGKKGVNGNFYNALKHATGDYIALCDQDDIWLPNKIEILLEHIDDYDIIHSSVELIDKMGQKHSNKLLVKEYTQDHTDKTDFIDFITIGWMLGCTSLIRRELVEKAMPFPDDIFFHDWWMTFVSLKEGNGIKFINTPTIKYRQHTTNSAQEVFSNSNWYIKKIKFNRLLEIRYRDYLMENEKIALRNNTNYCAVKYFLTSDFNGDYKKVDIFLSENKDLITRHLFNKFVELVADDVSYQYEHGSQNVSFIRLLYRVLKSKIKQPRSKFDKLLSKLYFTFLKPMIVTPYRHLVKKTV